MTSVFRRAFLAAAPFLLSGCVTDKPAKKAEPIIPDEYHRMYDAMDDGAYHIKAVDLMRINPRFYRQPVAYPSTEPAGTIVIDTAARFLYLVGENMQALRYGIGVGKAGLEFEGAGVVQYKREWPKWTPTMDMVRREPARYGPLSDGMSPGIANPLGARALYLFKNGEDTLYRIHGSAEEWSIGNAISSGCIRLLNQDIIDLYRRVPEGTRVVVLKAGATATVRNHSAVPV